MQRASVTTRLSIIIPVYNEEKRITPCLERIVEFCKATSWELEVIIADDGSTDKTADIVKTFESICSCIKLISWKGRRGKGASIKKVALLSNRDYVCYMDVDLATDPSEFEKLLEFKDEYDVLLGSRLLPGEKLCKVERPLYRDFFSKCYSLAFRILFRAQFYDPQCGFKLFRREALIRIFENVHNNSFAFDSEVVVKGILLGYRVKEVAINWKHVNGSKIRVIDQIVLMGKGLLSIWHDAYLFQSQRKGQDLLNHEKDADHTNNQSLCRGEFYLRMKSFFGMNTKLLYYPEQD